MADRYLIEPHERMGVVYGLHSGDGVIRYVGKTLRLKARMTEHLIHARAGKNANSDLTDWVNSLDVLHVAILDHAVSESILESRERARIVEFGLENLLNRETSARRIARGARSTRRGRMLFSSEQVASIRERAAQGETRVAMATEFGVHRDTIEKIVNGRTYP